MMWSICAVFICFCLEDFGLFGGSLSQCVWLWSQLYLRVWDELCALCAEIQWALFGVSGYLSELLGVFVSEIKPLMFLAVRSLSRNWGFGSWQTWFRGLETHMLTVCCWAYHLSPGISVCIILIRWGQYASCRVPVRVSIVCKGPGFRLSFSKCFLSTCHIPEHYWRSLGQDRTDEVFYCPPFGHLVGSK